MVQSKSLKQVECRILSAIRSVSIRLNDPIVLIEAICAKTEAALAHPPPSKALQFTCKYGLGGCTAFRQ